jgi:HPt (histidine-containing phosphotransfer) domain-containing protein
MNLNASDAAGDFACRASATSFPSGVLDVEGLCHRCMGNIDLVQRVLKMFAERMPEEMATIEKAIELRDTEQVARVAHRVRGTSASVSADGLMRAATEIEDVSRQGRLADLPPRVEQLRGEWEKYLSCAAVLLSAANAT